MKIRTLLPAMATVMACSFMAPAHAGYVRDVKIGEAMMANSGDAAQLAAIQLATGVSNLTLDFKTDVFDAFRNPGTTNQWFLDVAPATPGFFLLKFGIGGTNATANTFFFENVGELTKLVWSNDQVQYLSGTDCFCSIGRLSHYAYTGHPPVKVPEPMPLALLGISLIGMCAARSRFVSKNTK